MDGILLSGQFTAAEIRRLNYCRLYLQAQSISDLTTISGDTLDLCKIAGRPKEEQSSITRGVYINQQRPSEADWKLWRKANLIWSDKNGVLYQPLGPWLHPIKQQRQQHSAYRFKRKLWVRRDCGRYLQCKQVDGESEIYYGTQIMCSWRDIVDASLPIAIFPEAPNTWRAGMPTLIFPISRNINPATFDQYINNLAPWEAELLSHIDLSEDPFTVSDALSHGLRGVSDGSVWLKQMGAHGWTMSNDLGERAAAGMGPAPGANPNSYRSEAYGMLAMLTFLKRLAEFTYQYEPWQGIVATDSLSLVDTIRGITRNEHGFEDGDWTEQDSGQTPLDPLSPEWDLVVNIRRLFHEMPGLQLQHVRGHQDRRTAYHRLSLLAQLNVDADEMANKFQRDYGAIRPFAHLTEGAGVHLVTPKGSITSNYTKAIRHQATHGPLLKYIQGRNGWTEVTTNQVNWQAHGMSLKKRMARRDHYTKLVHGILPTNHHLHRRDPSRRGCPICNHRDEDWSHILRCNHPSRAEWRTNMLASLRALCDKWNTRPHLRDILLDGLQGWLESSDPDAYHLAHVNYAEDFHGLITQQNKIGWKHAFLGRFSWEWSHIQDAYYVSRPTYNAKKCRKGLKWQVAIIGGLWDQWYLLWESRNKDLHGADTQRSATIERRNALRTLRELYELRNQVEPSAQELLMADIRDHEAKPTWHLKTWIAINESVLRASYARVKKLATSGMRSLRHYWPSV